MIHLIPEQTSVKAEHLNRLRNSVLRPPTAPGWDEEVRSRVEEEAPYTRGWGERPPDSTGSHVCPSVPAVFQWLKQIEGTEAALTQKMLDLEKEKVKDLALWEAGGWKGFRQFPSRTASRVFSHAFICTRF